MRGRPLVRPRRARTAGRSQTNNSPLFGSPGSMDVLAHLGIFQHLIVRRRADRLYLAHPSYSRRDLKRGSPQAILLQGSGPSGSHSLASLFHLFRRMTSSRARVKQEIRQHMCVLLASGHVAMRGTEHSSISWRSRRAVLRNGCAA